MAAAAEAQAAVGAAEQKLVAAHQALLKTRGLQFDFTAVQEPKPPAWLRPLLQVLDALGPVLQPILTYLFWGGLILGLGLIAWFVIAEFMQVRLGRAFRPVNLTEGGLQPAAARARALLEEADGLAAAGRFEEAIHVLLFRSIDDIAGRRPGAEARAHQP